MDKEDIYAIIAIEVGIYMLPYVLEIAIVIRYTIVIILFVLAVLEMSRWIFSAGIMEGEMRARDRIRALERENCILRGRVMNYVSLSSDMVKDVISRDDEKTSQRENYDIEAQKG